MNTLLIIRSELFSVFIMLFLICYDRYCAKYRDKKNVFFLLALVCLAHCVMALITEITVNMDGINPAVNDVCHVLFFLFSLLYSLLYLDYAVQQIFPKGNHRKYLMAGGCALCLVCVLVMLKSPIYYLQGHSTKYSAGVGPTLCYALGFVFFILANVLLIVNRKTVNRDLMLTLIPLSFITLGLLFAQIMIPEFLFTAPALTITAIGLFFAIENPVGKFQKRAFTDAYLHVWNRNCYEYDLEHIIAERLSKKEDLIYVLADINGLKAVNDNLSHQQGDKLLEAVAQQLQTKLGSAYKLYRIGGDEFAAFYFDNDVERVKREINAAAEVCDNLDITGNVKVGVSIGYALQEEDEPLSSVIMRAEAMMYDAKREFYRSNGLDRRRS